MRKQVFGRKFKRDANERKALLKGLMTDLVLKEKITTTEEKAKAIKGHVEKLITKAKKKGQAARPLLQPYLSLQAVEKVIRDLADRFAKRPGGYVRIIKLNERFGDNASMAVMQWVEKQNPEVRSKNLELRKEEKKKEKVETTIATSGKSRSKSSPKQPKSTKKPQPKTEKKTTSKKKAK